MTRTPDETTNIAVALFWQRLTPLPCGKPEVGGGKAPYLGVGLGWKPWQTRRQADEAEVRAMFKKAQSEGAMGVGLVCTGLLVVDIDHDDEGVKLQRFIDATKGIPYVIDHSPHGAHIFVRTDKDFGKAKSSTGDILCGGRAFVRVYSALGEIPWVSPEQAERLVAAANESGDAGNEAAEEGTAAKAEAGKPAAEPQPMSLLATMMAQGWKAGSASNGWTSLQNGTKTAAISADGSCVTMFSTTLHEPPTPLAPTPPILSFAELSEQYPQMPPPVIDGLLRESETMLLYAPPKTGKSYLSLRLAHAVASGTVWCDFPCAKGRVLVIDNESHPAMLASRYAQIGGTVGDAVDFLPVWQTLYTVENLEADAQTFKERGYKLVILDVLSLALPDWCESENDNRACARAWGCIQRAAAISGAATAVLHHARKSQTNSTVDDACGAAWSRYASTICTLSRKPNDPSTYLSAVTRSFSPPSPRKLTNLLNHS